MLQITGDEVNFIVHQYLLEAGFEHSAFTLRNEAGLNNLKVNQYQLPPGILLSYLEKALSLIQIETHLKSNGEMINCKEPFSLLYPHICSPKKADLVVMNSIEKKQKVEHYEKEISIENARIKHMYPTLLKCLSQPSDSEQDELMGLSWNPNKNILLTYGKSGLAEIWNVDERISETKMDAPLPHITEENSKNGFIDVVSASWNRNGVLASGGGDGIIRIWDEKGEILQCLRGHDGGVIYSCKWSPNSNYLLTVGSDHLAIVWDASTSRICHKRSYKHSNAAVMDVDWKNNMEFATCAGNEILLWNQDKNECLGCYKHQEDIQTIRWDPSGVLLFSLCEGAIAKIWASNQEKSIFTFTKVQMCNWYANGSALQFVYCEDKCIKFVNLDDGKVCRTMNICQADIPVMMSFSPDSQVMAIGFTEKLELWCMKSSKMMNKFKQSGYVRSIEWSSNGHFAAVLNKKKAFVLDVKRLKEDNDMI